MKCEHCGATVSVVDPAAPTVECPYCKTVQPTPRATPAAPVAGLGGLFADRDGDGVPDVLDALVAGAGAGSVRHSSTSSTSTTVYEVNGQRYTSLEEMPPAARQAFDEGQRLLEQSQQSAARFDLEQAPVTARAAAPARAGSGPRREIPWRTVGVALFVIAAVAAALLLS